MRIFGHEFHNDDDPWDGAPAWAVELREMLAHLINRMETMMADADATLDQILADVTGESTQIDGLAALITGLQGQVAAIPGLTAAQQTEINTIFSTAESNKQKIANALATGAPPTPPPAQTGT